MSNNINTMRRINPLIRPNDLEQYENLVTSYRQGKVSSKQFVSERLLMGIYGQRQQGMLMVRAKLPTGELSRYQLTGLAEALDRYSANDNLHLTSRQDVQFYSVTLNNSAALLRHLASYDIATREAGGNTIRNITSCAFAGVCPQQHVDVNPYIQQLAHYFNHHPLTQALPRKFKISFSGCHHDCANGLVQDLGFIATTENGINGFKVVVGGGLGASPIEAIVLESLITEDDLIPVVEAVIALHDHYSDRDRRSRSRLKFIVKAWGAEKFLAQYRIELKRTKSAYDKGRSHYGQWLTPHNKVNPPLFTNPLVYDNHATVVLPVAVPQGELSASQLREISQTLSDYGIQSIKLNFRQGFIIPDVLKSDLISLSHRLQKIGVKPASQTVSNCPGSVSCPLGITDSKSIAIDLDNHRPTLNIGVNGCQNGCANANIIDIGLSGRGVRHHGKLVPSYTFHIGGNGSHQGALALNGPNIPAQRVIAAVNRIEHSYLQNTSGGQSFYQWSREQSLDYFECLLADLATVSENEIESLIRDYGDSEIFRIKSAGIGECAGNKADPVNKLLLEASYESGMATAFAAKAKWVDAVQSLEQVLLTATRALLISKRLIDDDQLIDSLSLLKEIVSNDERSEFKEVILLIDRVETLLKHVDELNYPPVSEQINQWLQNNRATIRTIQADIRAKPKKTSAK